MLFLIATLALLDEPSMPVVHAGASEQFLKAVLRVGEGLEAGEFAAAESAWKLLPKRAVRIDWDDAKVPANRRAEFALARDRAISEWAMYFKGFEASIGKPADIRFTFMPDLPPNVDSPTPAGAVAFFSENPAEPRLEVVIALNRGVPAAPVEAPDVHNEVGHGLASYYGLARFPGLGSFSTRTEAATAYWFKPAPSEALLARNHLELADYLKKLIDAKKRPAAAKPRLHVEPAALRGAAVTQGDVIPFSIQLTNLGNAPLRLRSVPDCGCLVTAQPPEIAPNGTALLKLEVETKDDVGELKKKIVLYTNDPEQPIRIIPVELYAKPVYRLLVPDGAVAVLGPEGGKRAVYMAVSDGVPLAPIDARVDGVPASVTFAPWSGDLEDLDLGEPKRRRKGYKFVVTYGKDLPPGRLFSSLVIQTDGPDSMPATGKKFEILRQPIQVQRGIVALPDTLNVGEIQNKPQRYQFLVSRPGEAFAISRVESGDPHLSFSVMPVRENWEYKVVIQYDGKAGIGLLQANVTVHTSDKRQPVIRVPFQAVVR